MNIDSNYVIIIGCGELGNQLVNMLLKLRKNIVVIDKDENAFTRLPDQFSGFTIEGDGIEEDILLEAEINHANLVVAVTGDDNTNIMIAEVAKLVYNVPGVIARLKDPSRGKLFDGLNINTICPTDLSVQAFSDLLPNRTQKKEGVL
jgi:trk system potassium uptake protein TrkA